MTAALVQSRIASAVVAAVEDHGQRAVGHMVGHAGSTLSRWGGDLGAWSASALLALALADDAVRSELLAALADDAEQHRARGEAPRTACAAIADMSAMAGHLAADLAAAKAKLAKAGAA